MVEYKDILNIGYYAYGEAFTGSSGKLRYRIATEPFKKYVRASEEEKKEAKLRLFYWYTGMAFDKTDEKDISIKDFEYSANGLKQIVDYINEQSVK